jgi:hypothetical protein
VAARGEVKTKCDAGSKLVHVMRFASERQSVAERACVATSANSSPSGSLC